MKSLDNALICVSRLKFRSYLIQNTFLKDFLISLLLLNL